MIDLPASSSAPASAARQSANTQQRDPAAQSDEPPFQATLTQQLAQSTPGKSTPEPTASAASAKAKPGRKGNDDAAHGTVAGDAPASPANAAVIGFPPALGAAPLAPAADPAGGRAAPALSLAASGTDMHAPGFDPHGRRFEQMGAGKNGADDLSNFAPAADFAASGKFALSAEDKIRSDAAFDTIALDPHKMAPNGALHAQGNAPASSAQAPAAVPTATLQAPVGEGNWDRGLGDKLVWMANQKHQVAELHLNPPELGPLKITLTLNHDHASAQFVSAHAPVRDAIEAAMPRLRETLADSGITLGNASVSTGGFHDPAQAQQDPRAYGTTLAAPTADASGVLRGERLLSHSLGLVDIFA